MVKQLDDKHPLADHIGLDLWRAATGWRRRLHSEMAARGHTWYGDARGAVVAFLDPGGMSQSELVARMGMTKQAVQQLLDGLESDGVVVRKLDPNDGRSWRIAYTARGMLAIRDAVKVKRAIERVYRSELGDAGFEALRRALRKLAPPASPQAE